MRELRLLPAFAMVWAVLLWGPWVLLAAPLAWRWSRGQVVLMATAGLAAVLRDVPAPESYVGTVVSSGKVLEVARPGAVDALFNDERFPDGTRVVVEHGVITAHAPPEGWWAFAGAVKEHFRAKVAAHTGAAGQNLIPAMVLGDTELQSHSELYADTGLSHLSAVSGSNISIVTTTVFVAARLLGAGPKLRVGLALSAMAFFVGLVGPEPSVLRASVTGLVGLAAVANSARMQPAHALCLGGIFLLLYRPDLATNFGFALSMAATAGLIALFPALYRMLAPLRLPDVVTRALAVAMAADIATLPLVAAMTGRVSLVSVLANVLVAPAAPPLTVLGLASVALPGPVLNLVEPFAWWIHTVAVTLDGLPLTTVAAAPATVVLVYGWIVAGLAWRPRATVGIVAVVLVAASVDSRTVLTVPTDEDIPAHPAAEKIVVLEKGPAHDYPSVTKDGIPVEYPHRR